MLAFYEASGDERALRALTWCLDDPRFHFFGNPITLPAAACDTWRYNGDANIAKAIDNFCAAEPRPHKWPAMRYGLPVCHEALSMSKRHDSEGSAPWDWRLQHGVLCYESMLSWVKASLWTGDGKYLANVRAWLDLHERVCRQPHGVIVSDEQFDWSGPQLPQWPWRQRWPVQDQALAALLHRRAHAHPARLRAVDVDEARHWRNRRHSLCAEHVRN